MSVPTTPEFRGFRREAVDFLADLAQHNERSWFEPRKGDYARLLKEPLAALCAALRPEFDKRGLALSADSVRSPYRIYRDTRFSPDKSPYTTHASASFPWNHRGRGFSGYFHLAPGRILAGGGMWTSDAPRLAAWRSMVLQQPSLVHDAIDSPEFVRVFGSLDGDRLKRLPAGLPADHPDSVLLGLKTFEFTCHLSDEEAFSPDLPATIADLLAAAKPVFELLDRLPEPDPAREPAWAR